MNQTPLEPAQSGGPAVADREERKTRRDGSENEYAEVQCGPELLASVMHLQV